jgi:uncharacterized protein
MIEQSIKNKLEKLLDPYEEAFTIDELCGFLYGVAITPEAIIPSEWLLVIFSGEMPEFESKIEAEEVMKLLMDAYNQFIRNFHDGTLEFPYDYQEINDNDDFIKIEDWCGGFSQAVKMRGNLWMPNVDSAEINEMQDEIISCIAIIGACSDPLNADKFFDHEYSTDPKIKKEGYEEDKLIVMLFSNLPMAVESLTGIGAEMASMNQNIATPVQPIQSHKIGRNEPCPCGSGKKFKKCCIGIDGSGEQTIH